MVLSRVWGFCRKWAHAGMLWLALSCIGWISGCRRAPEGQTVKPEVSRQPAAGLGQEPPRFDPFPWARYEAEEGKTTGHIRGPSRVYYSPESESSGRRYVRLDATGQFVEFAITQPGDGLVLRYCVPDAPEGNGQTHSLSLYRNGKMESKLTLTSRHAWIYGDFPWSNDPKQGRPHHFYDESRWILPEFRPGDVLRLQKDQEDCAEYYLIDFIELEKTPAPLPRPPESLSLEDFGARGDDEQDDRAALVECLRRAEEKNQIVWVPRGNFRLEGGRIPLGKVRVQGEGVWYSCLTGSAPMFAMNGQPVFFSDLAVSGDTNHRNDNSPDNAFDGNFGDGSVFRHVWIEHLKCGFWTTAGTQNMRLEGCRIRNTMADGLNFCDGSSDSTVEFCHLRNTGDDALATWSPGRDKPDCRPSLRNAFLHNRIELPWHANGMAIYGGGDHRVCDNTVTDTVFSGGGLLISSGFESVPFSGEIVVDNNSFLRTGGECYIGEPVGGLWIHGHHSDIDIPVRITALSVIDSTQSAVSVHGPMGVRNLQLAELRVDGLKQEPIHILPRTFGKMEVLSMSLTNVTVGNMVRNDSPEKFQVRLPPSPLSPGQSP